MVSLRDFASLRFIARIAGERGIGAARKRRARVWHGDQLAIPARHRVEDRHAVEGCTTFGASHPDHGGREELDIDGVVRTEVRRRILERLKRRHTDTAGKAEKACRKKGRQRPALELLLRYHANISRH